MKQIKITWKDGNRTLLVDLTKEEALLIADLYEKRNKVKHVQIEDMI